MIKTKILIIIPSLSSGGAEKALVKMLKYFDYSKYEVHLCVVIRKGVYFDDIPNNVKISTIFNFSYFAKLFEIFHIKLKCNFLYRQFVRYKIKDTYDVGISFQDSSYTDLLFFLNDRIKKKIAWIRSSYQSYINYSKYLNKRYINLIINERYKKLDAIVFVSNDAMKEFINVFGVFSRMEVIYNLMDVESVKIKAKDKTYRVIDNNICNIVALGSLYPVKGYDKLIYAADLLKKDGIKFKINIIGDGFLRKRLLELVNNLGLKKEIDFIGYLSNPYPLLSLSDIYIMTSLSEALPNALCEAMILGLPVIATNCSGCREVLDNGLFGMMVEQTPEDIYEGLKEMITNKDLRKGYVKKSLERSFIFDDHASLQKIYNLIDN